MPGRRASVLLVAVALAACSLGEDSPALDGEIPPGVTTTTETSTTRPNTTTTRAACPDVELATSEAGTAERPVDADGDGEVDVAQSFPNDDGTISLVVDLAAGGGAREVLASDDGFPTALLGGADVDGDRGDELWLRVGSGAATLILGLYRLDGCDLEVVTYPNGDPVELPIGGSVANVAGAECASGRESVFDEEADLVVYEGRLVPGGAADEYEVTTTEYRLEDDVLTPSPDGPHTETSHPDLGVVAGFQCGDLAV
jgi:hypothetical protein